MSISRAEAEAIVSRLTAAVVSLDAAPESTKLKELLTYWQSRRSGSRPPSRAAIDPTEMRVWLPSLVLFDVIDGGRDFRCRLAGTAVVEVFGFNGTGKLFSGMFPPDIVAQGLALYKLTVDWANPVLTHGTLHYWRDKSYRSYECLHLPLASDEAHGDKLLIGYEFAWGR